MNHKKLNLIFIFLVVSLAVVSRLIPHAPNFTPVFAICIWMVTYMSARFLFLPVIIMFVADCFIGFYDIRLMLFVYLGVVIISLLGFLLKKNKNFYKIILTSIFASLIFYFVTNFGVWYLSSWYSHDIYGMINCYIMGLPFLKNSLISDMFYLVVLVFSTEFVINGELTKFLYSLKNFFKKHKKVII